MTVEEKKARVLVAAARAALTELIANADQFKDADEFHRSLIRGLEVHEAFAEATRELHAHARSINHPERGQFPRQIVPAGRVQAPRHDTPRGHQTPKYK